MQIISFKNIIKLFLVIILSSVIGYFLMVLVYTIPTENISKNVYKSYQDNAYDVKPITYGKSSAFPNYTELVYATIAMHEVENPFIDALKNKSYSEVEFREEMKKDYDGFIKGINNDEFGDYGRYWHGEQVILKPMLSFMTYDCIRSILLLIMIIIILYLLYRFTSIGLNLSYGLIMVILFLNPITISLSLVEWICPMISFISMCVLINMKKQNIKEDLCFQILFCLTGVSVAFFDILRFPLITLGLPLVLYIKLFLNFEDSKDHNYLIKIFNSCVSWGLGYSIMWIMKWVYYTLITGNNKIEEGIHQVLFRISSNDGESSINIFIMLLRIAYASLQWTWPIFFILTLIYYIKNKRLIFKKRNIILFMIMFSLPLLWVIITRNHSFLHTHIAYRNFSIPLFAFYAFLIKDKKIN